MIVARVIQGVGGAIFPLAFGIIRDEFPRERVAGGIALISAILGIGGGLGHRARRPDRRHPLLPLALLDPARRRRRSRRSRPSSSCPSRRSSAGRRQLGRRRCCCRGGWSALLVGDQRGARRGAGAARAHRAVRRSPPCSLVLWVAIESAIAAAARRHGDDAHPRRLDDQRRRLPARRRDVQLVRPDPAVRRDAGVAPATASARSVTAGRPLPGARRRSRCSSSARSPGRLSNTVGSRVPLDRSARS